MAKRSRPGAVQVYALFERFVDVALRRDGSLFATHGATFTTANLEELEKLFIGQPDASFKTFTDKLHGQISAGTDGAIQLMAEILCVHLSLGTTVGGPRKRELIATVLGWMRAPVPIPAEIGEALDHGLIHPGAHYNTRRPDHLAFLVRFLLAWKAQPTIVQTETLADPWKFKHFVYGIDASAAYGQREALLHVVHPGSFEAITSREHKRLISDRLGEPAEGGDGDVDRSILQVRARLEREFGRAIDFYEPEIETRWKTSGAGAWDAFIQWARRFRAAEDFDRNERDYKLRVVANLKAARAALAWGESDWMTQLRAACNDKENNLVAWQARDSLLRWLTDEPAAAKPSLEAFWRDSDEDASRIRRFLDAVPRSALAGPGTRLNIASFLMMAVDPYQYPIYRSEAFRKAFELTDTKPPRDNADEAQVYAHALDFLDRLQDEAERRGLELRDRLDAQSVLWCVTRYDAPVSWSAEETRKFKEFRGEEAAISAEAPEARPTLEQLAAKLFLDPTYLGRIVRLLEHKRQVIFYGPPGTGKTFVARKLAEHLAGSSETVQLVQFHPSYAYEDFVEGFRPAKPPGSGFTLRPGPLKILAEKASDDPQTTHVLVIDEINRGNLAKLFGELYFLLEYRDATMQLQYSDEPFLLPRNLLIIGTMNSADRSIALVDAALRRRFFFVPFFPDEPPVQGLLHRWLHANRREMQWVARVVDAANAKLGDRHLAIGPSHFMRPDLDEDTVELIWEHAVLPYLAESFLGEEDRMAEFDLARLRAALQAEPSAS